VAHRVESHGRAVGHGILDHWSDLVDPGTGIVREVTELRVDDDDPRFVHFLSTACDTAAFGLLPNFGRNGGAGATAYTALAKALGEAVERYCSAVFDHDDLVWSPYERLDEPATPPEAFALYLPEQYAAPGFPWRPFTDRSPIAWTRGRSLVTGGQVLVPAPFVFVPYHYRADRPDTPIAQPISTGLACGSSVADATLSALCEVIERDAFTTMWQAGLSRPRIRIDPTVTGSAQLRDLVDRFNAVDIAVHLVDIGTDVRCPTVMAIAECDAATSPALAFAAAAHPDPPTAARKAIEELAHTRRFAAQVMDYLPPVPVDVAGGHPAVDGQRAHLRFYCPQDAKPPAAFAWSAGAWIDLSAMVTCRPAIRAATVRVVTSAAVTYGPVVSGRAVTASAAPGAAEVLSALVCEVSATGSDVIACDLTTPDVAELGLSVVRVVVPGFHPLQMGHANRCLGGTRLPAAVGVDTWSAGHDNPYPHPFP
jgi:ribosomal protein S12 methylthiotransferase accessory factor